VLWHDVTSLAQYVEVAVNKPRCNLQHVQRGLRNTSARDRAQQHGTMR
jgi:hypothetical protein